MTDDRKWEIKSCLVAIQNWYAEDGYFQRKDYHREPLGQKEKEHRKELIDTAIASALKIVDLMKEEKERVDGS